MEAFLLGESIKSVGVAAMLLALTRTLKDEETAKRALTEAGHKFVVTEVGGKTSYDDFHEKVNFSQHFFQRQPGAENSCRTWQWLAGSGIVR